MKQTATIVEQPERKQVEVGRHRVPLKQLIHGKEIREAMAALEKYRQKFNEQEFFYGAKVYLSYSQGECHATVKRPETDKELATRLDAERREREAKAERKRLRELRAHEKEQRRLAEEARLAAEREAQQLRDLEILAAKLGKKLVDL